MGVRFQNVNWKVEEAKAIKGQIKRREQKLRRQGAKEKQSQDNEDINRFFCFLLRMKESELRILLKRSVHAYSFFMIVFGPNSADENIDKFLDGSTRAENMKRSDILMALEWKQAFVEEGIYADNCTRDINNHTSDRDEESRQDIPSSGRQ